jgi:hypothetical protein
MTFQRYITPPIEATGLRLESVAEMHGGSRDYAKVSAAKLAPMAAWQGAEKEAFRESR